MMAAVGGPLKGIRVVELVGLAPSPMVGLMLSDFGAKVVRVDRIPSYFIEERLARGKKSIAVNLKTNEGISLLRRMTQSADVLLDPFRPGVMEKLGLGPEVLMKENPRLVYARLSGFGQTGPWASKAGHGITYLALSGVLSTLGAADRPPQPPINLLDDFGGGSAMCTIGILLALFERHSSNLGQIVDASITEGSAYLCSFLWRTKSLDLLWGSGRGKNILDGGTFFYNTYRTKDDKFVAVGAFEDKFQEQLLDGLGITRDKLADEENPIETVAKIFAQKTRDEWMSIFEGGDACVEPVLSLDETINHPQHEARCSYKRGIYGVEPTPAPILSRTPALQNEGNSGSGENTLEVMLEHGYTEEEVKDLANRGIVQVQEMKSKN